MAKNKQEDQDKPKVHDPRPIDTSATIDKPAGLDPTLETEPRKAGQDPNPEAEPNEHASQTTPDASATPPQRVQSEKSNQSMIDLPSKQTGDTELDTGIRYKVKILRGTHAEGGQIYKAGDVFESRSDLVGRFGTEKFESAE